MYNRLKSLHWDWQVIPNWNLKQVAYITYNLVLFPKRLSIPRLHNSKIEIAKLVNW